MQGVTNVGFRHVLLLTAFQESTAFVFVAGFLSLTDALRNEPM